MTRNYKAFISYSWSDRAWGEWLHRTLETYRTPKQIVGAKTPLGPAPARLHPIFKDREEEAAGHGIGAAIEEAMGASEFLIVLCSPRSAKSKWVNREVAWFKTHKSKERILALVVDGEPGASLSETAAGEECFPATLLYKVDETLQPTEELEDVPLAADARKEGDGKRIAKLKLAAALLGVGLDDLVKRDDRRRAVRRRWVMSGMAASMVVLSALTVFAFNERNHALLARADAEAEIEYMITDLKNNLQQEVQLKVLGDIATRAQDYYQRQDLGRLDDEALGRRARVLGLLSDLQQDFGNSEDAISLSQESLSASAKLVVRNPNDQKILLTHAHMLQGMGNTAFHIGDLTIAEQHMKDAVLLTEKLVRLDEQNPQWKAEQGSALANLGIVQMQKSFLKDALENLKKAAQARREYAKLKPDDRQAHMELGVVLHWMAEISLRMGEGSQALDFLVEQGDVHSVLLSKNPADQLIKSRQILNSVMRSETLLNMREFEEAGDLVEKAASSALAHLSLDKEDTTRLSNSVRAHLTRAEVALVMNKLKDAEGALEIANRQIEELKTINPDRYDWSGGLLGRVRLLEMELSAKSADNVENCNTALRSVEAELLRLNKIFENHPTDIRLAGVTAAAQLLTGDHAALNGEPDRAEAYWRRSSEILARSAGDSGPPKDLASQKLIAELDARWEGGVDYVLKAVCGLP